MSAEQHKKSDWRNWLADYGCLKSHKSLRHKSSTYGDGGEKVESVLKI